jgi:hypothetical protein
MPEHVSEDDIERLAHGRLPTADSLRVQRHLFNCDLGLKRLIEIEYQIAVEEAIVGTRAPVPDERKPLFIVHDTGDGPVYSRAEKGGRAPLGEGTERHKGVCHHARGERVSGPVLR